MKNFIRERSMWCYVSGVEGKSIETKPVIMLLF